MISFRLRTKWQSCRGYVPCYGENTKISPSGIHSVFATHVETVVLMSRGAVRPVDERFERTGAEAQTNRDSRQKAENGRVVATLLLKGQVVETLWLIGDK